LNGNWGILSEHLFLFFAWIERRLALTGGAGRGRGGEMEFTPFFLFKFLPRFHFYPCFSGEPRERAKRDHVFLQPVKKKEKTQRKGVGAGGWDGVSGSAGFGRLRSDNSEAVNWGGWGGGGGMRGIDGCGG